MGSVKILNRQPGFVLVVDDNNVNRYMLAQHVIQQGHRVETSSNGREALQMLLENAFDLVLLDVNMPEMDGYAMLEAMRDNNNLRSIPVIMISGVNDINSVVRCIERGAEDYLFKPFNQVILNARIGACLEKKRLRDQQVLYLHQIEQEQRRSDDLLRVILPATIMQELKTNGVVLPRRHAHVAVMFVDIVGFTNYCDEYDPEEIVSKLQQLIECWENIALDYAVEKIKTIGDAFMATAGLLKHIENPVMNTVYCAEEMITATRNIVSDWEVRIGIHSGPVVAGVIGRQQYSYDLWGDTVNTAARMESYGVPGSTNLSLRAWQQIAHCAHAESLGLIPIKGKGNMEIFKFKGFINAQ